MNCFIVLFEIKKAPLVQGRHMDGSKELHRIGAQIRNTYVWKEDCIHNV